MPDKSIHSISPESFVHKFTVFGSTNILWQNTPVQIYPLSKVSKHLLTPTPLFRPTYNFLVYVRSGSFTQQVGTQTFRVQSPALLWILNGAITSIRSISEDIEGYFLLIKENTVNTIYDKKETLNLFTVDPILTLSKSESNWICSLHELLKEELEQHQINKKIVHGLLQVLLQKVLGMSDSERALSRKEQLAIEFKQLVYRYYKERHEVSFYADQLAVSKNYLNRCVNTVFNKSTKELITEIRILQSQLLLWDISLDIAEIGYKLHFEDPSYFSRVFKKVTGQTPSEYRTSVMHDLS